MERRDLVSSCFWAGIGVLFCAGSLLYGFGSAGVPGGGFLPFLTGLCLLGLSILQLVLSLTKRGSRPSPPPGRTNFPAKEKTKRILMVLGALLFYVIALERLGFAVTSVLFMIVIIALDVRKWRFVLLAAFSFTACFYILFRVLLSVPLPLGPFGI
jgi:putative tricarboxylic transport membrane protein